MDQQPPVPKVCHPIFGNAKDRIQTKLRRCVVVQRGLRDLEDQENVLSRGILA